MRFAQPQFLWLLLVLPPGLALFFGWSGRLQQRLAQRFIQARLLPGLTVGLSPGRRRFRRACLVAAVACLLLALARPQWGFTWEEVRQRGLDIVIALDVSKSMLATDVTPNRLARAKLAALDLLQQASADRVGLVAFAGTAFLQCPLTLDEAIFRQSLEVLDAQTISQGGTALAEAIETALQAFKEEDNYKVLVLLTDGEDHDSGALEAAQRAAKTGLRIFTVGVGTPEGELLRFRDAKGREDYVRDEQGNVVKSRLNEALLQQIAGATQGGFYLPLRGPKVMETLYERGLAPLPKSEGKEKFIRRYHERFHWPLAAALTLLVLEVLWLEAGRAGRGPRNAAAGGQTQARLPAAARVAAVVLLLLVLPLAGRASPADALREYEAGRYDEALKSYQQLLEKRADDPRLRFNAGAAAYRSRQFGEAARQFEEAARAPDLQLQEHAYYNLGNTLYRAGEAAPDPQQTIESWERALQQYERALRLNTNNADARFNRDLVQRKLEELKQQQQQRQPDQKNESEQQDQQQEQPPQTQDPPNTQDQKQSQQQQETPPQEQQQQPQEQQPRPQDQRQQEDRNKPKEQQAPQQPPPPQKPDQKAEPSEEQQREAQARAAGQMTPREARQLLDSLKGDEQLLWFRPESPASRSRSVKDW